VRHAFITVFKNERNFEGSQPGEYRAWKPGESSRENEKFILIAVVSQSGNYREAESNRVETKQYERTHDN
jgi:hypothetical protein